MSMGQVYTALWVFLLIVVTLALFGVIDVQTSPYLRVNF